MEWVEPAVNGCPLASLTPGGGELADATLPDASQPLFCLLKHTPGVRFNKQKTSLQRRLWELPANEAAFRSATISKTSFWYIETGPPRSFCHMAGVMVFSHQSKTTTRQDKCWTCAFLWCLSHQTCRTWCERHHRNAQVQHLSCRLVVLLWCENTIGLTRQQQGDPLVEANEGSTFCLSHSCFTWFCRPKPMFVLDVQREATSVTFRQKPIFQIKATVRSSFRLNPFVLPLQTEATFVWHADRSHCWPLLCSQKPFCLRIVHDECYSSSSTHCRFNLEWVAI